VVVRIHSTAYLLNFAGIGHLPIFLDANSALVCALANMALRSFIETEREQYDIRDNNLFAFCFGHIDRYQQFLRVTEARQRDASQKFVANSVTLRNAVPSGTPQLTDEQRSLLDEGAELTNLLHLEIESFYLFAKILLDKVAHSIEFYFGSVRSLPLDSHDDLVKNFAKYAAAKKLAVPDRFHERAALLKKDVSDFRDYEIAHEKSPRRMSGTGFSSDGRTTLISNVIYPTPKDQQVSSRVVGDLLSEIDSYIDLLMQMIVANRCLTRLKACYGEAEPTNG
jgi:hypothetical protein